MYKIILVISLLLTSIFNTNAGIIKIEYSGIVDNVWEAIDTGSSYDITHMVSSTLAGESLSVGESFTAWAVFETNIPESRFSIENGDGKYAVYEGLISTGYDLGEHHYRQDATFDDVWIYNNGFLGNHTDMFQTNSGAMVNDIFMTSQLQLWDNSGTVFEDLLIPDNLLLTDFNRTKALGSFVISDELGNRDQLHWEGELDFLKVTQVPSPNSFLLFVSVLLASFSFRFKKSPNK